MKISAIDVGSNSVRLGVFADGKTLYKRINTTRLSEGLSFSGALKSEAIERTALAVAQFAKQAKEDGAERIYAFATAAVRSASNGREFTARVKELCGIEVEVISGQAEAEIGILGALGRRDGGIIDVGGASTEVTVKKDGKTVYSKSVDIGAVRLYDLAGRDKAKLLKVINEKIKEYKSFNASNTDMYAIGGTATTIASVKHALKVYDPNVTHGTVLSAEYIGFIADKCLSLSIDEVRAIDGMDVKRADVIGGGCLLLYAVMQKFGIAKLTVSESDNLEGYIMLEEGRL